MKRIILLALFIALLLSISGCSVNDSSQPEQTHIDIDATTYDCTYQDIVNCFMAESLNYSEIGTKRFSDDESLVSGVIYMSDNEYEICRVKIRTYGTRVFQVYVNYDISGDEVGYENFPVLLKCIVKTIKPELPDTYIDELNKDSEDHYSNDYQDLRITLQFSEKYLGEGILGTAVDCYFIHLDRAK